MIIIIIIIIIITRPGAHTTKYNYQWGNLQMGHVLSRTRHYSIIVFRILFRLLCVYLGFVMRMHVG